MFRDILMDARKMIAAVIVMVGGAVAFILYIGTQMPHRVDAQDMMVSPALQNIVTTTVASLPACTTATNGIVYRVTDALLPVILGIVIGGGAVNLLVECKSGSLIVG